MLSYPDHCKITREQNGYDEYDEPLAPIVIYDGECDFQWGETTRGMITVRTSDKIYIPGLVRTAEGEMISNGDVVDWVTESGRKFHGVVDEANDVKIELDGSWVTEIEIKQGTGKTK